jgi:hypothetical protein
MENALTFYSAQKKKLEINDLENWTSDHRQDDRLVGLFIGSPGSFLSWPLSAKQKNA